MIMDSRAQIRNSSDDWLGVQDATERKRLQNRLAQRARRAKKSKSKDAIVQAGTAVSGALSMTVASVSQSREVSSVSAPIANKSDNFWAQTGGFEVPAQQDFQVLTPSASSPGLSTSSPFNMILTAMSVCSAGWENGGILHLSCERVLLTSALLPSTPPALVPTELQLTVPHLSYIDILPFPSMRNRIIAAMAIINEDDFRRDIAEQDLRCWGRSPWDSRGWELTEAFVDKWWFLMDESTVAGTNWWRRERGEPEIVWKGAMHGNGLPRTVEIVS